MPSLLEQILAYMQAGGQTMIPIILFSLIIWTLSLVKIHGFITESRAETTPEECLAHIDARGVCSGRPYAAWQRHILTEYLRSRCDDPELNRKTLETIRLHLGAQASRFIPTIFILSAIAPLLGLLGTVSGMISTFDVISQFGTGNARALASGISEALVTTQSGLVVAVPGMLLGGVLYRRAEKLKHRMELFCIGLQYETECGSLLR